MENEITIITRRDIVIMGEFKVDGNKFYEFLDNYCCDEYRPNKEDIIEDLIKKI